MSKNPKPFFSIGVTTYDRLDLLKEALSSIVFQTFPDFEVIVGNDNPHQVLSPELLNITDERICFVNRTSNLGELPNMNDLLARSRGRYFTWLADDDLYAPNMLESVYNSLHKYGFPLVAFTSYVTGNEYVACGAEDLLTKNRILTGRQFLREYLMRSLKTIGCCGFLNTEYLRRVGGMQKLGNGFSPYSDNLLAIGVGLLHSVIFIDEPLYFFRTHQGSISNISPDLDAYQSAHEELLQKSMDIFKDNLLKDDYHKNLSSLLVWCIQDYFSVMVRSGKIKVMMLIKYLFWLFKHIKQLDINNKYKLFIVIIRNIVKKKLQIICLVHDSPRRKTDTSIKS